MKYGFIKKYSSLFSVKKMCKVFDVSRSGYYSWKTRPESKRSIENKKLLKEIEAIHHLSRGTYGSPRITKGLPIIYNGVSRNRVARIMARNGIRSKIKPRFKVTTQSNHSSGEQAVHNK